MPIIQKKFKFKKTKNNGNLAGKEVVCGVPSFDWEEFKNLPHAKAYVEKMYFGNVQQLVREERLNINSTSSRHLQSMEGVISKFVTFSQEEVKDWCDSREWGCIKVKKEKVIELIMQTARDEQDWMAQKYKENLVEVLGKLCDKDDPIAEYLFVKLSGKEEEIDWGCS